MINKAILIGNLGNDPDVRYTQGGTAVANFSLATTESWVKDGKKQEKTEWHRIVAFGRLAEVCGEYLAKGSKVFIEGPLQTRQWEDRKGSKHHTTEIVAQVMKILSGKSSDQGGGDFPPSEAEHADMDVPF